MCEEEQGGLTCSRMVEGENGEIRSKLLPGPECGRMDAGSFSK